MRWMFVAGFVFILAICDVIYMSMYFDKIRLNPRGTFTNIPHLANDITDNRTRAKVAGMRNIEHKISTLAVTSCPFNSTFDANIENPLRLIGHYPVDADTPNLVRRLRRGEKVDISPLNDFNYDFLLRNECHPNASPFMVFLIKTRPESFDYRQTIRETWGNESLLTDVRIKRIFVLGKHAVASLQKKLEREQRRHGDLIQANFTDTYRHTTIKMMTGLRWATHYCSHAKYVVFADDDVVISSRNTVKLIKSQAVSNVSKLYLGWLHGNHPPVREKDSKWYVSVEDYPFKEYPVYPPAGTIIVNMDFAQDVFTAMPYVKMLPHDDVYLGVVARKLGVYPMHTDLIHVSYINDYDNAVSILGEYNLSEIRRAWTKFKH